MMVYESMPQKYLPRGLHRDNWITAKSPGGYSLETRLDRPSARRPWHFASTSVAFSCFYGKPIEDQPWLWKIPNKLKVFIGIKINGGLSEKAMLD